MDGQAYDPLLGSVRERLEKRSQSASSGARQGTGDRAETSTSPPDEAVRDASLAANLRDVAAAGFLHWIMSSSLSVELSAEAFKLYRDKLLQEACNPSDPIEVMLIEQIALAHFAIGRLHIRACSMDNAKLSIAFSDAATRLLGEFRRCSLALEQYREKQAGRTERSGSIDGIGEQTASQRNGAPKPSSNGEKEHPGTELGNNGNGEMPEWLRKRMAYPTPNGSKLAAATAGNEKV